MFFKPKSAPIPVVTPALAAPGLHLMLTPTGNTTFSDYAKTVMRTSLRGKTGIISRTSAIVPYLTVRANIYIDGPEHDLALLPPEVRNDTDFLDSPATKIGQLQRLYIEFFRSVLADKKYILIADVFATLSGPETRRFLTVVNEATAKHQVSVIILTEDATLTTEFNEVAMPLEKDLVLQAVTETDN